MRTTRPTLPRTFRTSLVPWIPAVEVFFAVWLISKLNPVTWIRFAFRMGLGLLFYARFGYHNTQENRPPPKKE
ncbi:amino acid permease C-terminal domain-containing protein [Streptomyces zagrosensis]|uniref:Cationic amino acid transporter C-terminal domain-containing protein n=1 Tax=Streptomyces zagrosensis TaxID=1042984 RepID=A0A7W9Q9L7_9ACTN|nr:amino acid permease C-terminal domain-containing protein [Streptomyces zagrosensis]MBB5936160.1 hypothetical protein [Streptomyces zagrosensis]